MTIDDNDYLFLSGDHTENVPACIIRTTMIGEINGRYEVRALQRIGPDWTGKAATVPHMMMCYRFSSKSRARRLIRAYQSLGIPARLYRWRRS